MGLQHLRRLVLGIARVAVFDVLRLLQRVDFMLHQWKERKNRLEQNRVEKSRLLLLYLSSNAVGKPDGDQAKIFYSQ